MPAAAPQDINEYLLAFPEGTQQLLRLMETTIRENAPQAEACISYAIPTFKLRGKALVHFAAFKNHIGFYALPTGHEAFKEEFSVYKTGKGSVQFPMDRELPLDLIARVVRFRVKEVSASQDAR